VLGLAFKPNTDDMRDAPSIPLVNSLIEQGARVAAFDPAAMDHARRPRILLGKMCRDRVKVTGFQNDNNKTFTVVSATEGEIVVDRDLVDEAEGREIGLAVRTLPADIEFAAIEAVKALYFQRFASSPNDNIKEKVVGSLDITYGDQIQPSGLPLITERILAQNYVRLAQA